MECSHPVVTVSSIEDLPLLPDVSLLLLQSIVRMVAPQFHNVDIEDMAPDSGATIQKGLRKVAVYKDSEGKKHAFSALCPHLGCLLQVGSHIPTMQ